MTTRDEPNPPTEHDKKVSAYLVPVTDEVQHLAEAMKDACTDLGVGAATPRQMTELRERVLSVEQHLVNLRLVLRPEPRLLDVGDSGGR